MSTGASPRPPPPPPPPPPLERITVAALRARGTHTPHPCISASTLTLSRTPACYPRRLRRDSVKAFWRRRKAAARYKRAKKDDTGGDDHESAGMELAVEDEPSFYETLTATFTGDKRVECTVDLGSGGKTHTIDAFISTLEKVSELPFLLQESCKRSGVGELAALSLVDLWIHERARIQLTEPSGMQREVGRGITPTMCLRATAFRVTILPQQTR
jgi:hypothetical protein